MSNPITSAEAVSIVKVIETMNDGFPDISVGDVTIYDTNGEPLGKVSFVGSLDQYAFVPGEDTPAS